MAAAILIVGLIIIVVAVVVLVCVVISRRERRISATFARLASQFDDGELVVDSWGERLIRFTNRGMVFEFAARDSMIRLFESGRTPSTLRVAWPNKNLKLHIERRHAFNVVTAFFARSRVLTGVESFDRKFMTTGRPHDEVAEMLRPAVSAIVQLNQRLYISDNPFELSIEDGAAVLRAGVESYQNAQLEMVVRLGVTVFEGLANISSQGVEFVTTDAPNSTEEAICRICGDALDQLTVQCASCKTLHHHECWNYAGGCSTYGCGQTKYLTVSTPLPDLHESTDS